MFLARKNESIRHISAKLLENQRNLSFSNRKTFQSIINELKNLEDDSIWEEFELRFNEVHQGFYKRIKKQFPNLSINDLRLCAFLKLNLSTKDIASITYQTPGSIDVARARLQKKLGINNTNVNLTELIQQV
jgi:DNA-binding CsgD family transcriptional regulator